MPDAREPMTNDAAPRNQERSKFVNYSLRHAKNIERKMMGEVLAMLAPLAPLASYRYVGMGSEFFNDFALYHQLLGIGEMISIERDLDRIERCNFNRPYKCIKVLPGESHEVLPTLSWERRSIVWLDYTQKLNDTILKDVFTMVTQAVSGSFLIWSVNANPWSGSRDEDTGEKIRQQEWPDRRIQKLKALVGDDLVRRELKGTELTKWGLAREFHLILTNQLQKWLNDRNSAALQEDKLSFHQCLHFRYADTLKMLTVGGILVNAADAARLGPNPFASFPFVRLAEDAYEIRPPKLTSREVRFLNRLLPHDAPEKPVWLEAIDWDDFRQVYRYYPIFSESEL